MKESAPEFAEEFKSPIKHFVSPWNSTSGAGVKRFKEERKQDVSSENLKAITQDQIELFKQNKDLILPAAKVLLSAYILVNGPSEDSKQLEGAEWAGTWEYVKGKITKEFIASLISIKSISTDQKTSIKSILSSKDMTGFKATDIVEPILEYVKARVY